jgi:hypothetical protein
MTTVTVLPIGWRGGSATWEAPGKHLGGTREARILTCRQCLDRLIAERGPLAAWLLLLASFMEGHPQYDAFEGPACSKIDNA